MNSKQYHHSAEEIKKRFDNIRQRAVHLGVSPESLETLDIIHALKAERKWEKILMDWIVPALAVIIVFIAVFLAVMLVQWPIARKQIFRYWYDAYDREMDMEPCLIELSETFVDLARPPVNCDICAGIKNVDRVANISKDMFEYKYAYSARPAVIEDGAKHWSAPKIFSFKYFKSIYSEDSPVLTNAASNCQFFPYKTSFKSLAEVFNMSDDRAHMRDGSAPWYIGWSNCDSVAANLLRQHYDRPYFLPDVAESSKTDWIFMGSPGYGAHMHVDNVGNPSWQAQITGVKLWTLEPPPECYHVCEPSIEVKVHPGEIIVLDTNQWFHATLIVDDEMSITIGSEYD